MNPTINRLIEAEILARFTAAENRADVEIPDADKVFLIRTIPYMLDKSINKFINGAVEHHDSPFTELTPDQQIDQAIEELVDLPFYLYGYLHAKATRSKGV